MPSSEEPAEQTGLLASSRRLIQLALQTLHTRVELLSIELREETVRGVKVLVLLSAFIFLAAIALLLISFTVIFSVWDDPHQRIVALWTVSGLYVLGAAVTGGVAYRILHSDRLPFADTLREFQKDGEWIRNASRRKEEPHG